MRYAAWIVAMVAMAGMIATGTMAATSQTVTIPAGEVATGRCVSVHDGDTLTLLVETPDGKRQVKIRMDGIDAPEIGQPAGKQSREALAEMVFGKQCSVESRGTDKYGRTIGRVSVDDADVNAAMLDAGMAWHYQKYDHRADMAAREAAARQAGIGIWGDPSPVPPWDWRKFSAEQRREVSE